MSSGPASSIWYIGIYIFGILGYIYIWYIGIYILGYIYIGIYIYLVYWDIYILGYIWIDKLSEISC